VVLRDIEVDESDRESITLAVQRHAKISDELQVIQGRCLQVEKNYTLSSTERMEISSQIKDIKTRIKADTSWLTMKHTEYVQYAFGVLTSSTI